MKKKKYYEPALQDDFIPPEIEEAVQSVLQEYDPMAHFAVDTDVISNSYGHLDKYNKYHETIMMNLRSLADEIQSTEEVGDLSVNDLEFIIFDLIPKIEDAVGYYKQVISNLLPEQVD